MNLEQLRDALRETKGPDRELDAALWWRFEPSASGRCFNNAKLGLPTALDHDGPIPAGLGRAGVTAVAPAYSASIDAAVGLVPKKYRTHWGVHVAGPDILATIGNLESGGATPALALCLARVEYEIEKEQQP